MIKKILLTFIVITAIAILSFLYFLDNIVKRGIEYAGVEVEKVERVTIGNWNLENIRYQINKDIKLTIKSAQLNFIDIDVDAVKIIRSLQAFRSKIHIKVNDLQYGNYKIKDIECDLQKKMGTKLEVTDIYISDFGKKNKGHLKLDLNNLKSVYLNYKEININNLVHYLDAGLNVYGHIDIVANLKDQNIDATVTSSNLILKGFKVDEVINNFLDTRSFGLLDVAGFVALGPIGLLYTSAGSLGVTLNGFRGGETKFTQINTTLNIKDDLVSLNDVAFATQENLVAVAGKVNLKSKTFEDIVISIVDEEYCPRLQQSLSGTFDNPDYSKTMAFLDSATAPLANLTNSTLSIVGVKACKPAYQGVVKFPLSK